MTIRPCRSSRGLPLACPLFKFTERKNHCKITHLVSPLFSRTIYKSTYKLPKLALQAGIKKEWFQTFKLPDLVALDFQIRTRNEKRDPYVEYGVLAREMGEILKESIPFYLQEKLEDMWLINNPQTILIKNCPVTAHPGPTPEEDKHNPKKGYLDELFVLGLMNLMHSNPYHDRKGKYKEVIGQVIARRGSENELSSRGSKLKFNFHTEIVQVEHPIEVLTLSCIKGDPEAVTQIASVDSFVEGLPQWVIDNMQAPIYEMRAGPTWDDPSGHICSILEPDPFSGYFIRFNSDFKNRLIALNEHAKKTLTYLSEHLEKGFDYTPVILEKGDLLVINNRKVKHARDGYIPTTDWNDRRWLLRGYARLNWPELVYNSSRFLSFSIPKKRNKE